MNRTRGFRALAIAAILIAALPASVAHAGNFGSNAGSPPHICDDSPLSQCTADNGFHAVCFQNLLQPQVDAMRWSFINNYDPIPYVS